MGRIIEGLWDCPYCGTKGIGGSKQWCSNCGRSRTKDTTFYLPGQKRYLSNESARKVSRNPDWICEYCDNLNSDNDSSCTSCGAKRSAENLNYFQNRAKKQAEVEEREKQKQSVRMDSSVYEDVRYREPEKKFLSKWKKNLLSKKENSLVLLMQLLLLTGLRFCVSF